MKMPQANLTKRTRHERFPLVPGDENMASEFEQTNPNCPLDSTAAPHEPMTIAGGSHRSADETTGNHVVAPVHHLFGVKSRQPEPVPGLAPPAIQEGQYVARLISRRLRGQPPPAPFEYLDKGSLAIVGRDFAIADFKVLRLWGWPAWWLWLGAHIFFLIGFANRLLVMTQWAVSFLSNRRLVRIFPPEEEEVAARALEDEPEPADHKALSP